MTIPHHDPTELMAATDWEIDGTLLDVDGQPLDLSNATLQWSLIGPQGTPVLQKGDATIAVTAPAAGTITTAVHPAKAADARMRALYGRAAANHWRHRLACGARRDTRSRHPEGRCAAAVTR